MRQKGGKFRGQTSPAFSCFFPALSRPAFPLLFLPHIFQVAARRPSTGFSVKVSANQRLMFGPKDISVVDFPVGKQPRVFAHYQVVLFQRYVVGLVKQDRVFYSLSLKL
jgi:hypothetical protein